MRKIKFSKMIALLAVLIFAAGMMACGKSNTPEDAVKNYFKAIGKGDFKSASQYAELSLDDNDKAEDDVFTKNYFKKISCKVESSEVDGETATVKAEVSAPDMGDAMTTIMQEYMPKMLNASLSGENTDKIEKDMQKAIEEIFSDESKIKIVKTKVDIKLIKKDDSWVISEDNLDLGNALMGNIAESLQLPF